MGGLVRISLCDVDWTHIFIHRLVFEQKLNDNLDFRWKPPLVKALMQSGIAQRKCLV
jgi:hypothetical protein